MILQPVAGAFHLNQTVATGAVVQLNQIRQTTPVLAQIQQQMTEHGSQMGRGN